MSTEYRLAKGLSIVEYSNRFEFMIDKGTDLEEDIVTSVELNTLELRRIILQLIFVLSYFSDDSEEVLQRFNCSYYDEI